MRKSIKKQSLLVRVVYNSSISYSTSSHSPTQHKTPQTPQHNSSHKHDPSTHAPTSSHYSPGVDPHKKEPSSQYTASGKHSAALRKFEKQYENRPDSSLVEDLHLHGEELLGWRVHKAEYGFYPDQWDHQRQHYDVVIIGAGAGGLALLNGLASDGYKRRIAIIDPSPYAYYQPGWTLVGAGLMGISDTFRPMNRLIPPETAWLPYSVTKIDPENNSVSLSNDTKVSYSALLVATGYSISLDSTPGLKEALDDPACPVVSNYSFPHVTKTFKHTKQFRGGDAIFTQPKTPIKCGGAPQKVMYLADAYWRFNETAQRNRRNIDISFVTGTGKIFSCEHFAPTLNAVCDRKGISRSFNTVLTEVRGDTREAVFKDSQGTQKVYPFDFLHVTPEMRVPDVVRKSDVANKDGFVDVDIHTLQHNRYDNVFAIGDCAGLPTSRTASAVAAQSGVVRKNIRSYLEKGGRRVSAGIYDGYTACPIPTDYGKLVLCEFDYKLEPRESFWFDQRKESRMLYYLKKEWMPMLYWDYLLKGRWEGPGFFRMFTNPRTLFKKRELTTVKQH